jgi:hypothetical protein
VQAVFRWLVRRGYGLPRPDSYNAPCLKGCIVGVEGFDSLALKKASFDVGDDISFPWISEDCDANPLDTVILGFCVRDVISSLLVRLVGEDPYPPSSVDYGDRIESGHFDGNLHIFCLKNHSHKDGLLLSHSTTSHLTYTEYTAFGVCFSVL